SLFLFRARAATEVAPAPNPKTSAYSASPRWKLIRYSFEHLVDGDDLDVGVSGGAEGKHLDLLVGGELGGWFVGRAALGVLLVLDRRRLVGEDGLLHRRHVVAGHGDLELRRIDPLAPRRVDLIRGHPAQRRTPAREKPAHS